MVADQAHTGKDQPQTLSQPVPAQGRTASVGKPVVLMADADHLTGWSLRHYLSESWLVVVAGTVREAEDFLHQEHPDAVIVSDNLPGGNVDRLVELALGGEPPPKVIKLLPYIEDAQADDSGRIVVLEKPFNLKHLKDLLDESLSSRRDGAGPHQDPM